MGCRRMRMAVYASAQTSSQNQAANSPATGWPGITGTVLAGETLTATTDRIEDEDGLTDAVFAYRWVRQDPATRTDADIEGSDKLHIHRDRRRRGQGHQGAGHLHRRCGQRRVADQRRKAVRPTLDHPRCRSDCVQHHRHREPTITGTIRVGETLTADTTGIADSDGLNNATFTYQWLADDADITDATGSTYALVAADEERPSRCGSPSLTTAVTRRR